MGGFDWAKPASVYVAGVAVLWVLFVGVIAALYVALRLATGTAASGLTLAAFLAADGAIAAALGWWLLGRARRWAAERRAPREVICTLGVWSLGAIAVVTLLILTIGAATSDNPWPGSILTLAAARWPAMLIDYGFFWAVAVSVVPIPFLEAQYRPAGAVAPPLTSETPRRIAVRTGNRETFIAVGEVLAVTAAENYVELHLAERSLLHRATMAQMQDMLPAPLFLRVHRKSIVRVDAVTGVNRPRANAVELVLGNGRVVAVGRAYRSAVMNALKETVRHRS